MCVVVVGGCVVLHCIGSKYSKNWRAVLQPCKVLVFHTTNLKMWILCCGCRNKVWEHAWRYKSCCNDVEDWWGQKGAKTTFHLLFFGTAPWNKLFAETTFCCRWNWMIHSKIWPEYTLTVMQSGGWELWAKLSGRVNISFISAMQSSLELGLYKG